MELVFENIRYSENNNGEWTVMGFADPSIENRKSILIYAMVHNKVVTAINSFAFAQSKFEEVYIASSITTIGEMAFGDCENLRKVDVTVLYGSEKPNLLIQQYAFAGCSQLEDVMGHNRKIIICDYAFDRCNALKHIEPHIYAVGKRAFWNCNSLKTLFFLPEAKLEDFSLLNSSIAKLVFDGNGYLSENLVTYLKTHAIAITCLANSNLVELAHEGITMKVFRK